jgi:hypothetical protein
LLIIQTSSQSLLSKNNHSPPKTILLAPLHTMAGLRPARLRLSTPWSRTICRLQSRRALSSSTRRSKPADEGASSADGLNKTSRHVTLPKSQGASQAMLYATGLQPEDMHKAQVGISSVWYSGNPCNMHLMQLNDKVKEGVQRAG